VNSFYLCFTLGGMEGNDFEVPVAHKSCTLSSMSQTSGQHQCNVPQQRNYHQQQMNPHFPSDFRSKPRPVLAILTPTTPNNRAITLFPKQSSKHNAPTRLHGNTQTQGKNSRSPKGPHVEKKEANVTAQPPSSLVEALRSSWPKGTH
jgi:hypothetical protein